MPQASTQTDLNPIMVALTAGFSWIARGYAYDTHQLSRLIKSAITHKGTAFIEILQPCPVYNNLHDKQWYEDNGITNYPRIYSLLDEGFDPVIPVGADERLKDQKFIACAAKAREWGERIPTGLFYHDLTRTPFPPAALTTVKESSQSLQRLLSKFKV